MRTKAHRYATQASNATFTSGAEAFGVTGDFEGGFVQVSGYLGANVGAGQWITSTVLVDGIAQNVGPALYQSGATVTVTIAETVRVPSGRHRIGVRFSGGNAPTAGSCGGYLSVVETGA